MKWLRFYYLDSVYKLVYMLQQFEYDPSKLLNWLVTFPDLKNTINRGKLILTTKATVLLIVGYVVYGITLFFGVYSVINQNYIVGILLIILSFDLSLISIYLLSLVGKFLLNLKRSPLMNDAAQKFENTKSLKIAIIGSYGKTSMKEMLNTVLSEKFNVAMTPGNKNVPISHARWVTSSISGEEDILIIEYGEGEPGDIEKLASLSRPNRVVMTGIAPNHLDHYKTYENLIKDFLEIQKFVEPENLYINNEAKEFIEKLAKKAKLYSNQLVNGWTIKDISIDINGTKFKMTKGSIVLKIKSEIIGRHNVGPLALVASIGFELGMSKEEIESAMGKTKPFEHRMQPRHINGAWLIDDTYNGNLMGFKAGLELLNELKANRKIYVTPGLVDQGEETEKVHHEIAIAINNANPDKVILMKNSNTVYLVEGLNEQGFSGDVEIEENPLEYYNNIDQFLAGGDVVLMQNDLPDAYS